MPTVISHGVAAAAIGKVFTADRLPARFWFLSIGCAMLPDIDVLGFAFGIRYGDMLGHRGITHSLPCALMVACLAAWLCLDTATQSARTWLVVGYFFIVTASHGILDAMTNGGSGGGVLCTILKQSLLSAVAANRSFSDWPGFLFQRASTCRTLERNQVDLDSIGCGHNVRPINLEWPEKMKGLPMFRKFFALVLSLLLLGTLLPSLSAQNNTTRKRSPAGSETRSPRDAALRQRALAIHRRAIVIDTHNDVTTPMTNDDFDLGGTPPTPYRTNIERMKKGGMTAEFFSLTSSPGTLRMAAPRGGRST